MRMLRIGLAQINATVGDLGRNGERIIECAEKASAMDVDILALPELAITGYPPEDLLLKKGFVDANLEALHVVASRIKGPVTIAGFVDRSPSGIYNAAAVIHKGKVRGVYRKELLPNYGVFDEKRYFIPGERPVIFRLGEVVFGIGICEDIWCRNGPISAMASSGAGLIFNINASPYHAGKISMREEVARSRIKEHRVWLAYTNLVGGQDELVFDGQSFVMDKKGSVVARAEAFKEDLLTVDIPARSLVKRTAAAAAAARIVTVSAKPARGGEKEKKRQAGAPATRLGPVEEIYEALKLGLHDYVVKNGFKGTVIGLSGGIDSALVAALAADALGKENVVCVFMPSRYTSAESREDAEGLAKELGTRIIEVPIDTVFAAYHDTMKGLFAGLKEDITEENIQARIRGNILMALSNKFGWLVLTTGNKSEMSVGYATLYGDMAGGFAVIKDVPKTLVYKLCGFRNSLGHVIPDRILTKEPTAELKPDQLDRDTLPPYDILDRVLRHYVEEDRDLAGIEHPHMTKKEIARVLRMVDLSEYKRRQSPPGIKITPRSFGRDRRMPITNKYKGSQ